MSFVRANLKVILTALVVFASCAVSFETRAETVSVRKYDQIFDQLRSMELVIFDLDSTLVRSQRMFGSDAWFEHEWEQGILRGLSRDEARKEAERLSDRVQSTLNYDPVEPGVAKLIHELQASGVRVMIETARRIPQMDGAFRALREVEVDMSLTAPKVPAAENLVYRNGVLFANAEPKGVVLERFLKAGNLKVSSIAFVDDKLYNLKSVIGVMRAATPRFLAVHYRGADEYNDRFRQDVSNYQKAEFLAGRSIPSDAVALRSALAGGNCRLLFTP